MFLPLPSKVSRILQKQITSFVLNLIEQAYVGGTGYALQAHDPEKVTRHKYIKYKNYFTYILCIEDDWGGTR